MKKASAEKEIITLDDMEEPYQASIADTPLFFSYSLEHLGDSIQHQLLLLNVSTRTKLQIYVHFKPFPDKSSHYYPLGDLAHETLEALFDDPNKMEIFEDSTPFVYDKASDQVVYRRDFGHINPETMYPGAEQFVDASKIS